MASLMTMIKREDDDGQDGAQYQYILHMSPKEAETLLAITGNVAGSARMSPRKYSDAIYRLLHGERSIIRRGEVRDLLSGTLAFGEGGIGGSDGDNEVGIPEQVEQPF